MSIKEIKTRITLPMHSFWKKFQRICILLAGVVPTTGQLAEYYNWLPEGTIPQWLKTVIGGMILLGIFLPLLSVKDQEELKSKLK